MIRGYILKVIETSESPKSGLQCHKVLPFQAKENRPEVGQGQDHRRISASGQENTENDLVMQGPHPIEAMGNHPGHHQKTSQA